MSGLRDPEWLAPALVHNRGISSRSSQSSSAPKKEADQCTNIASRPCTSCYPSACRSKHICPLPPIITISIQSSSPVKRPVRIEQQSLSLPPRAIRLVMMSIGILGDLGRRRSRKDQEVLIHHHTHSCSTATQNNETQTIDIGMH
jgi:hypothetical protein